MPDSHSLPAHTLPSPLHHGGDLARVMTAPGAYCGRWLDLSTGINPWPYPVGELPQSLWARLPGSAAEGLLREKAALYYRAADPECVVAAPGSQALIQWLPRLRAFSRVAVLGPTYGEHAPAWSAAGHELATVTAPDALAADWDVAVVTNPNNPDGRRLAPGWLLSIAEALARRQGWLVVDEAFADLEPALSLAPETARPGLIVLRSFGKFFGLAGLRLGFALAAAPVAARLRAALGPWAVSGPATAIAAAALADSAWIEATRARLAAAAGRLDALLAEARLQIVGGTALYRLVETPHADTLRPRLLGHGIYVREFPERPTWLRFGLPPDEKGFARLRRALVERGPITGDGRASL